MKIVFLAPFGIRPKGTVIARMLPLAVELQRLGHEVVIVAPPYTNPEDSGTTETIDGVLLRNIVLGPRNRVLAAPILAVRMLQTARAERPDLIHLFKPKGYGGLAAMLLLILRRFGMTLPPLFVDTDDWEGSGGMNELHGYSSLEKRFYAFQEQWLTLRARGVTVASRALDEMAQAIGKSAERILYLPNCVREAPRGDGADRRGRLGIAQETPVVLLYTRFFEFDQGRLHRLFAAIARQLPSVRFLVVGQGRHGEESLLMAAAGAGGFLENLLLAGWVEPADLPGYLAVGDVAVYPFDDTLLNRCKCPAKATELLLAGCPLVAERVGQLAEYIQSDTSGILCHPGDEEAMAAATVALLQDAGRRRTIGDAGRAYLLENFGWSRYAEKLDHFYRALGALNHGELA